MRLSCPPPHAYLGCDGQGISSESTILFHKVSFLHCFTKPHSQILSLSTFVYTIVFTKLKLVCFLFSIALTMNSRLYFMTAFVFKLTGKDYFSHGRKVYTINRLTLYTLLQLGHMVNGNYHRRQPL
jgi:hypothetical protein